MKRAKLGTKSKKAALARKIASPRSRSRAKTKSANVKEDTAPKTKPYLEAKHKKVPAQVKLPAKKSAPSVLAPSGAVTRKAKVAGKIRTPRKSKVTAPVAKRTPPKPLNKLKAAPKRKPALPAFLLEGDEPSFLTESGAAEKFSLGPTAPPDHFDEGNAPLPSSYGTGKLFLTARDPHWLYAHWDFTHKEQFHHNAKSIDRHLILRLHDKAKPQKYIAEVHVHPESKHWFIHVEEAGRNYSTELGYYRAGRKWKSLATSAAQRTPPDNISTDSTVEFATIPTELSFETMLCLLEENCGDDATQKTPLARAIENIRHRTRQHFPESMHIADWTLGQEQLLAEILAADSAGSAMPSSQDSASIEDQLGGDSSFIESPSSYVSSFFGCVGEQNFRHNMNAELIPFGATKPESNIPVAGKQSPPCEDGSFRFPFALPDGKFEMPIIAVSADGTDGRAVELNLSRATEIQGNADSQLQYPE